MLGESQGRFLCESLEFGMKGDVVELFFSSLMPWRHLTIFSNEKVYFQNVIGL